MRYLNNVFYFDSFGELDNGDLYESSDNEVLVIESKGKKELRKKSIALERGFEFPKNEI